ncbi:hypothetical protein D3C86_2206800 [compost metagenome]
MEQQFVIVVLVAGAVFRPPFGGCVKLFERLKNAVPIQHFILKVHNFIQHL